MTREVEAAAGLTIGDLDFLDELSLREAARVIRRFLENYRETISGWRVWAKYAVVAVIGILDVLLEDEADGG